jgi:DMSO/TMAO reductase YedYZ heme-binding membrane subunit
MMPKALGGKRWKRGQRLGYAALILVVVHLIVLGLSGWVAPKGWPAWIPPISLVAVIVALIPLLTKGRRIREKRQRDERK